MSGLGGQPFHCWVYRSSRKDEMYLYLAVENDFDCLPVQLQKNFGAPRLVMELDLQPHRPLAREDINRVIGNLQQQGFHLQLPPKLTPELYHGE